jgi:hypothetical protein
MKHAVRLSLLQHGRVTERYFHVKLPDETTHLLRCKEDIQKLETDQDDVNSYED